MNNQNMPDQIKKNISVFAVLVLMSDVTAYAKVESFEPTFMPFPENSIQRKKWDQFYGLSAYNLLNK